MNRTPAHPDWPPLPLLQAAPLYAPPAPVTLADALLCTPGGTCGAFVAADKDRRLGHVFEQWLLHCLRDHPYLRICTHNLPIRHGARTLGELDLVIHDQRSDRFEHWELTVKFYLGIGNGHWPGPNPEDNFARKARHLFEHQFPLSDSRCARKRLAELGVPRIDGKRLFSRGALFYPADRALGPPVGAHPGHVRGRWWHPANVPEAWRWLPIRREQWLGITPLSDKGTSLLASADLRDYVHASRSPVMVLGLDPNRPTPQSGFVVPEQWLADAHTSVPGTGQTD